MKVYRLVVENKKTGEVQYSEWTENKSIIEIAVKKGNRDPPDFIHWLDEEFKENKENIPKD